jgi:ribonuclease HI
VDDLLPRSFLLQCGWWEKSVGMMTMEMTERVSIYTDGACRNNPGPGGWAALVLRGDHQTELSGSEETTTNNRMEMMAAICALEFLQTPCVVDLYTDSAYLKDGMSKWIVGWQKNNWQNSQKQPVKNKDLWLRLLDVTQRHQMSWHWVKGHAGNVLNDRVDLLAKRSVFGN